MTPEGKIKKIVRDVLDANGAWYFMPFGGGMGKAGVPDIVGIHKGFGFGIECKAGRGKVTALQERELGKILRAGGFPLVVNENEGLETLLAWLQHG